MMVNSQPYLLNEDEYFVQSDYSSEGSFLDSIVEAKIGVVDCALLLMLWIVLVAGSVKNLGLAAAAPFILIPLLLMVREPSNAVLVWLTMFYSPELNVGFDNFKVMVGLSGFAYLVHGRFLQAGKSFNRIFFVSLFFVIYLGLLCFIAPNKSMAFGEYAQYVKCMIILFLLFGMVRTRNELGRVFKWWAIVAAISLVPALIHYYLGPNTYLYRIFEVTHRRDIMRGIVAVGADIFGRLVWAGLDANGRSVTLLFPLGLSLAFWNATRFKNKTFWLVVTLSIGAAIVGTFSRSGFLSMVGVLGALLIFRNIRAVVPVGISGAAGLLFVTIVPGLRGRILGIGEAIETGATGRFYIWQRAYSIWLESPFWGHGLRAFVAKTGREVHNTYLELMTDGGLIAVVYFLFILYITVGYCFKAKSFYRARQKNEATFAFAASTGFIGVCVMMGALTFIAEFLFWLEVGTCALLYYLVSEEMANSQLYSDESEYESGQ